MKTLKKHETVIAKLVHHVRATARRAAVKVLTRAIALRYDRTLKRLANS